MRSDGSYLGCSNTTDSTGYYIYRKDGKKDGECWGMDFEQARRDYNESLGSYGSISSFNFSPHYAPNSPTYRRDGRDSSGRESLGFDSRSATDLTFGIDINNEISNLPET